MKIRSGFVSNSSSSSFVVLTTKTNWENIKSNAADEFKQFLDEGLGDYFVKDVVVHGVPMVDLSRVIHDSQFDHWDDDSQNPLTGGYRKSGMEHWEELTKKITDAGGYVTEEGC